jgi:hypothetical protein
MIIDASVAQAIATLVHSNPIVHATSMHSLVAPVLNTKAADIVTTTRRAVCLPTMVSHPMAPLVLWSDGSLQIHHQSAVLVTHGMVIALFARCLVVV